MRSITLQTSDNDIGLDEKLGSLSFAASNESSGSDAILIGASIEAVAEGNFTTISNATSIVFATANSESATPKLKITSGGHLLPVTTDSYDIGTSSSIFRNGHFGQLNVDNLRLDGSTIGGSGDVTIGPSGNIYLGALPSWPFGDTPRSFGFNAVAESLYIGSNLSIGETADAPGAIEIIDNGSTHYIAVKNGGAVGGYIFIATGDVGVDMRGVVTITDLSDPGTGKLGIGTTSPSGALHVIGDAIVSSKIGINKENPAYALDVVGTGNFSQNLLVNGTGVSVSGHTHISSNITDFNEAIDDRISNLLVPGLGVDITYDDNANTVTIAQNDVESIGASLYLWANFR